MEILYLAALKEEVKNLNNFFLTGVGKINASFVATDLINKYQPKKVVNFGTAGSTKSNISGLVKCSHFIQHDMDVRGLLNFKLIYFIYDLFKYFILRELRQKHRKFFGTSHLTS